VGVKLGPSTAPEHALELAKALDPENTPGKLLFITRMGAARVKDALPPIVAQVSTQEELESLRQRLTTMPEPNRHAALNRGDLLAALAVFLLVFLSTFPVVLPFFLVSDAVRALRFSNAIAIFMLLVGGYEYGRYAGFRPWLAALVMVTIGLVLVAATIALGG